MMHIEINGLDEANRAQAPEIEGLRPYGATRSLCMGMTDGTDAHEQSTEARKREHLIQAE
ncbi:MAG TPA: hypothetical protein VG844_18845 [Terracidiphilus sp.]|nr:hypothetical protein [Terracidiphilus sp.]